LQTERGMILRACKRAPSAIDNGSQPPDN